MLGHEYMVIVDVQFDAFPPPLAAMCQVRRDQVMPEDAVLFRFDNEQGLVAYIGPARCGTDAGPFTDAAPRATIVADAWNIQVSISSKRHRL